MGISDGIGNNRAIIKAFSAYHLFELLSSSMSYTHLHIMWRNCMINLTFCEQAKFITNSLEQNKCLVIVSEIQVWHSLAHTSVLF